jgi:hypothetical protein
MAASESGRSSLNRPCDGRWEPESIQHSHEVDKEMLKSQQQVPRWLYSSEARSHYLAQVGIELRSSCLCLLSTEITGMYH